MSLTLYQHPLASFCHKVLIALYENETPFKSSLVDLLDPEEAARFAALWPVGKMPVLTDSARDVVMPETSIIIEYLDRHYPGRQRLIPDDPDMALKARLWDRFFDNYIHVPMQKIVTDTLRAPGESDHRGVADARAALGLAYGMADAHFATHEFAAGDTFSLADCAATPALFYGGIVEPFDETHPHLAVYFERLLERASVRRVLTEARPYFHMFPYRNLMPERFFEM
ncbi:MULTISPECIES: glutathione S-transferase family protein [unclassified Ensifer]|jgi:glutathione S-transferase|uniref:glutathione S-transferase family protein n=1 Tax=unclassified Ensifer TaxID=2633371 RepID=UPI000714D1D9|nr:MULTISPECIES: glutathione S-transferase family protein [unclassified Ensifer]OKP70004.1 glutathione S-transferase [Ensifer adhaerens]KQX60559.1 glutathione S-transferase [Ensifer sp. Root1298]KQX94262.1 glutathione S-transferase [Ensifer sp. Root1312]KRC29955.1 glutathione S-transferase [Ensifer sp. Root74]KRD66484.1 glutathione S-transferase [Ensifer sp. Root954]